MRNYSVQRVVVDNRQPKFEMKLLLFWAIKLCHTICKPESVWYNWWWRVYIKYLETWNSWYQQEDSWGKCIADNIILAKKKKKRDMQKREKFACSTPCAVDHYLQASLERHWKIKFLGMLTENFVNYLSHYHHFCLEQRTWEHQLFSRVCKYSPLYWEVVWLIAIIKYRYREQICPNRKGSVEPMLNNQDCLICWVSNYNQPAHLPTHPKQCFIGPLHLYSMRKILIKWL